MTIIQFINLIKSTCRTNGASKVKGSWKRYYDDGRILTAYGNGFASSIKSTDELYNLFVIRLNDPEYKKMYIKTACLTANLDCGYHIDAKEAINRLVKDYPGRVIVSDSLNFDPIFPLSVDGITGNYMNGKAQITLNVSGNLVGKVRIVWGSLANMDEFTIDPSKFKSITYERNIPSDNLLICATVI